jgi:hypothetical protein
MSALPQLFDKANTQANTATAANQPDPETGLDVVKKLNTQQAELRIWVDTANEFGHHATSMLLLRRMIDYGFTGPVRIWVGRSDSRKLELFLPGYTAGAKTLQYRNTTIAFQYDNSAAPTAGSLLLCGGSESPLGTLVQRLGVARCTRFLQLQPWNWEKGKNRLLAVVGTLTPPTGLQAVAGTGGQLPSGTYYFQITTRAYGETTASAVVQATCGANGSVQLQWNAVTNAVGYNLYRSTDPGMANATYYRLPDKTSFVDTGLADDGAKQPPTANTSQNISTELLDEQPTLLNRSFLFCAYQDQAPEYDASIWDLYKQNQRFAKIVPLAGMLSDYVENKRVLLLPAYGLATKSSLTWSLLTLILGCESAQRNGHVPSLPIVLLVFDTLTNQDWRLISTWLNGTATIGSEYPAPLARYVTANNIAPLCPLLVNSDASTLESYLDAAVLRGSGVVTVSMSGCPSDIFRYFYGKATLPPVFEGRGTQNLCLNLGRPYLCTNSNEGYPNLMFNELRPPEAKLAWDAVQRLVESRPKAYDENAVADLACTKFAAALGALLRDSTCLKYFADLKLVYGAEGSDKLLKALRFLREKKLLL